MQFLKRYTKSKITKRVPIRPARSDLKARESNAKITMLIRANKQIPINQLIAFSQISIMDIVFSC